MSNWYTKKLGDVAKIAASNVDKIIYDDEIKVKLCNYMDVYNGSYIESSVRMSDGSATNASLMIIVFAKVKFYLQRTRKRQKILRDRLMYLGILMMLYVAIILQLLLQGRN